MGNISKIGTLVGVVILFFEMPPNKERKLVVFAPYMLGKT
jgi:hypothetical protein